MIRSLTFLSACREGESSNFSPSPAGFQRLTFTPFGMKKNAVRSGGFARRSCAFPRGVIDSSNGSASTAPMPRSIVRRGIGRNMVEGREGLGLGLGLGLD